MRRVSNRTLYVHSAQKMPLIIAHLCRKVRVFPTNRKILPELHRLPGRVKDTYWPAREALAESMCALFMCMDLPSMRIGYPSKTEPDGFHYRSNGEILKRTRLGLRRMQRALARLKCVSIDFARCFPRSTKRGPNHIGFAPARVMTEWLLHRLGAHRQVMAARQQASEEARGGPRPTVALVLEGVLDAKPTTKTDGPSPEALARAMAANAALKRKLGIDSS